MHYEEAENYDILNGIETHEVINEEEEDDGLPIEENMGVEKED